MSAAADSISTHSYMDFLESDDDHDTQGGVDNYLFGGAPTKFGNGIRNYFDIPEDEDDESFQFDFEEDDIFGELLPMLKDQQLPDRESVVDLVELVKDRLMSLQNVIYVDYDDKDLLHVFGDTHGQFFDVARIMEELGPPSSTNQYLFNGDFVDRGDFSVELCIILFALALRYPDHVYLLKGNHESRIMTSSFGFKKEVKEKYDIHIYEAFLDCFQYLPLAAIVNKKVFICHGGLFKDDGITIEDIQKVDRTTDEGDSSVVVNGLLWSDPVTCWPDRQPSIRGCPDAVEFGKHVTIDFLDNNGLDFMIRSHQMFEEGYEIMHDKRLITVFSAPNYCKQGNKGSYMNLKPDRSYEFIQFKKAVQPQVKWALRFSSCVPS